MKALALLALVACSGKHLDTPEAPAIVVTEAGAEPRQRLRLDPVGSAQFVTTLKTRTTTSFTNTVLEDGQQSADFPSVMITGRVTVASRDAAGATLVTGAVHGVKVLDDVVEPRLRATTEAALAGIESFRGTWRVWPNGRVTDSKLQVSNGSRALRERITQVTDALQIGAILPDTPVGIGASWRVTSRVKLAASWSRVTTYRLRALTEHTATFDVTSEMRASEQPLYVEPNASVTLTNGTSSTTGELTVPLHGIVGTASTLSKSDERFLVVSGKRRITTRVQTETVYSFAKLSEPAP